MRTYLLLLIIWISVPLSAHEKHVIGHNSNTAGFFSCFIAVLTHIQWCIRNNKTPVVYWDTSFIFYDPHGYNNSSDNCWEYYFEPVSPLRYQSGDIVHTSWTAPDGSFIYMWKDPDLIRNKYWVKKTLIDPFIKIKKEVQEKVDAFYNMHMKVKKTIGIHLRGTDKSLEVEQISPEKMLALAAKETDCQFFIATDEEHILALARHTLPGNVITYECYRSQDGSPIHQQQVLPYNRAQIGEEVLITALLLARCDKMIHTNSNVSIAALYFNPDMPHTMLKSAIRDGKGNNITDSTQT